MIHNRLGADPEETTDSLIMITSSTEHNPCSEASSTSTSQEIPRILRNMKVYYRFHKQKKTLFPILNKSTVSHPIRYTSIIILSSHLFPDLPGNPFTFPHQYLYEIFFYYMSDKCFVTLPSLNFVVQITFSDKVLLLSFTLSNFLYSSVTYPSEEEISVQHPCSWTSLMLPYSMI